MRHYLLIGSIALGIAGALACSTDSTETTEEPPPGETTPEGGAVLPPSPPGTTGPAGSGLATGLPCDVQAVIEDRCIACHSGTSPPPLLNYDDLLAKSKVDPTKTMAQLSLERMKSATSPMPPKPAEAPDPDEIKIFEEWVGGGSKKGALCTTPPPDGGAPDGGAAGDGGPVVAKCTSGQTWAGGNTGSALMNPGEACSACHQVMGGPNLRIAGTIYPTLREPNDCNGSKPPPALTVVITDSQNRITNIPMNEVGNFSTRARIRAPYKAVITDGTKTRAMVGTVTSGDCNSCHTQAGANGAPGRILAP